MLRPPRLAPGRYSPSFLIFQKHFPTQPSGQLARIDVELCGAPQLFHQGGRLEQPALLPAPEREIDAAGAAPGAASLDMEGVSDGFHSVTGAISGEIDVDSPVYIGYNGAWYEALLTNDGFTAMLPGKGGGEYAACWYSGGELACARINIESGEG